MATHAEMKYLTTKKCIVFANLFADISSFDIWRAYKVIYAQKLAGNTPI